MDDGQIRQRIEELVAEEHQLWDSEAEGGSASDRERLAAVQATVSASRLCE